VESTSYQKKVSQLSHFKNTELQAVKGQNSCSCLLIDTSPFDSCSPTLSITLESGMLFSSFDLDEVCSTQVTEQCKGDCEQTYDRPPKVHFSTGLKISPVPNLCLLSEEEKSELWYPEPPPKKTKGVKRLLLCSSNRADGDDGGELHPIDEDKFKLRFPIEMVLTEQGYQRYEGSNDPAMVAKLYGQCSAHSAAQAQIRALHNEVEIRKYIVAKTQERRSPWARFLGRNPRV
jgi:hypothetical protein